MMKKIIGLLAVLFITTGVFGQKFIRSHSFIETTPTGNNTIEDWIRTGNNGNFDWIDYVHFVRNDKVYLLSYEPDTEFISTNILPVNSERDVYLYCKDINDLKSPWVIASDVVVTSNWMNSRSYAEIDFFRKDKSRGSKGEVVIDGDKIYITVGLEVMTNGRSQINEPITFGFKWNRDGSYHKFLLYQQNKISNDSSTI